MNNNNLADFKCDFNNLMRCEDIMEKYNISKTSYHTIVRKLKLTRPKTSKLLRTFNMAFVDNKPNKETKKDDNVKQVYHKPVNDPNITVVKKATDPKPPSKPPQKNTDSNIDKALKDAKQCIDKVQSKYVKTGGDDDNDNDKSALLQAIQKSNNIRSKMLNKKLTVN